MEKAFAPTLTYYQALRGLIPTDTPFTPETPFSTEETFPCWSSLPSPIRPMEGKRELALFVDVEMPLETKARNRAILYRFDLSAKSLKQLASQSGTFDSFRREVPVSSNGDYIWYSISNDSPGKPVVYDLVSETTQTVPDFGGSYRSPTWSWDSKCLIYLSSYYDKNFSTVYQVSKNALQQRQIPGKPSWHDNAVIRPGGKWLATSCDQGSCMYSLDNGQPIPINGGRVEGSVFANNLRWSPDGKVLAVTYAYNMPGKQPGAGMIHLITFDEGGESQYKEYDFEGWVVDVSWSPDGNLLLVNNLESEIIMIHRESGTVEHFPLSAIDPLDPLVTYSWSPDSQEIAYVTPEFLHIVSSRGEEKFSIHVSDLISKDSSIRASKAKFSAAYWIP